MAEIRLPNVNKNFGENWVVRDFNLDAKLRVQMRAELSKLHESLETTIVYVTHDQIEAMTLANRIVIMNEGRICRRGHFGDL